MVSDLETWRLNLRRTAGSFNKFLAKALEGKPDWAELLLFIDQFEELFTLVDKKYQGPFVDLLGPSGEDAADAHGGARCAPISTTVACNGPFSMS